jgi:hypothetical protein
MNNLNYIINSSSNNYNLDQNEISSLKEANILLDKNYVLYALNETWLAFYSHILRRIEYYGLDNFLEKYPEQALYKIKEEKVLLKWANYNPKSILTHARSLHIIDDINFHLLNILLDLKFKIDANLSKENYFNLISLLESSLLVQPFIESSNKTVTNLKRRRSDQIKDRRQRDQNRRATDKLPSKTIEDKQLVKSESINPFTAPFDIHSNQIEKYG